MVNDASAEIEPSRDEMPAWLWWLAPAGLAVIVVYSFSEGFFTASYFSTFGVAVLTGGAALMVGALLGFLFGVPRTLQGERPPDVLEGGRAAEYRVNTNLEQISDWLTKILVGVGLVQLGTIIDAFGNLADSLGPSMGDDNSGSAFALGLVVYFLICGFLVAYLWTRLNLTGAFARAEAGMLRAYVDKNIEAMKETVDERVGGVERDVQALSLAERQLDAESEAVPEDELDAAIGAASPVVRAQIFARARTQRSTSWRDDKPRMERTIPLFRALIASDPAHEFHRNFGQLGYALKDTATPDFDGAVEMLTEAIRIRGKDRGAVGYEFNRAAARIGADPAATPADRNEAILDDLRVVATSRFWREKLSSDARVAQWLARNGVRPEDLRG